MKDLNASVRDDRFWDKVKQASNGCWEWQGATNGTGYGRLTRRPYKYYAHRYSLFQYGISIPEDKEVHHLCRNRLCVKPTHLAIVSSSENTQQSLPYMDTGRLGRWQSKKTQCPQGHEYTEENTYYHPDKARRDCVTCRRASKKRWLERQRS